MRWMVHSSLITIIDLSLLGPTFLFSKKPIIIIFLYQSGEINNEKALLIKVLVDMHMLRYLDAPVFCYYCYAFV